jgi:hypothetical protein
MQGAKKPGSLVMHELRGLLGTNLAWKLFLKR